jgi:hypothetical protein
VLESVGICRNAGDRCNEEIALSPHGSSRSFVRGRKALIVREKTRDRTPLRPTDTGLEPLLNNLFLDGSLLRRRCFLADFPGDADLSCRARTGW